MLCTKSSKRFQCETCHGESSESCFTCRIFILQDTAMIMSNWSFNCVLERQFISFKIKLTWSQNEKQTALLNNGKPDEININIEHDVVHTPPKTCEWCHVSWQFVQWPYLTLHFPSSTQIFFCIDNTLALRRPIKAVASLASRLRSADSLAMIIFFIVDFLGFDWLLNVTYAGQGILSHDKIDKNNIDMLFTQGVKVLSCMPPVCMNTFSNTLLPSPPPPPSTPTPT